MGQHMTKNGKMVKSVQDFKKACMDASPAIVQGMAYAAVMKGQKFSANVKKTFGGGNGKGPSQEISHYNCGKTGHLQKNCRKLKGCDRKGPPVYAPGVKKGNTGRINVNLNFIRMDLLLIRRIKRTRKKSQKTR